MKTSKEVKRNRVPDKSGRMEKQPPVTMNTIGEEPDPSDVVESPVDEILGDGVISDDNPENFVVDEDRYAFGFSFGAQDGSSGLENEDTGDLPLLEKKVGQHYDETLSSGDPKMERGEVEDEISSSMHIADADDIGMSYGEDQYTEDDRQ